MCFETFQDGKCRLSVLKGNLLPDEVKSPLDVELGLADVPKTMSRCDQLQMSKSHQRLDAAGLREPRQVHALPLQ